MIAGRAERDPVGACGPAASCVSRVDARSGSFSCRSLRSATAGERALAIAASRCQSSSVAGGADNGRRGRSTLVGARDHLSDLPALVSGQQRRWHRRSARHHRPARLSSLAWRRRHLAVPDLSLADGGFRLRRRGLHRRPPDVWHARRLRPAARPGARPRAEGDPRFRPNHSSDRHPWFQQSRSSRTDPRRDWYIWRDAAPDGGPPINWLSHFGGSGWEWDEATASTITTPFSRSSRT
jgi:hypothetical protein